MANSIYLVWLLSSILLLHVRPSRSLGSTDTITWGGDVSRAGYQTNHNLDPAIVGSGSFGQIFKTLLPGNFNGIGAEQVFSQPLVYTGADGIQYVYLASTQNNLYKLDAKTGKIIAQRNLWTPFLTADLDGCVDINPAVGVTGTGVIDPATGIWYFTAKTYASQFQNGNYGPNNPPGRLNGRYYFHGINTADLSDAFPPTSVEGKVFRNNPNRMFLSGNQHQRPALLQVGNYIYAGFASHCVKWNFTGAIMGFNKATGAIVEAFATEGGPEANTIPGGGVWMSGGGLAYDGKGSMFFATGNGYASQLPATGMSVPGRNPPTSLEEAAVNAKINDDGTISVIDFFMPWEKTQLDGADKDLGTSPLELLPTDTFSCPNHKRIGMVTGKSGKTYWLNLDNLGGYQNGPNKKDDVIQVFQNENSVYAGAGVMPLGGGYVYTNVIQYPTHVFKFSCDSQGNAVFTHVSDTSEKCAYILGVGHGTTTSLNGQDGTGLYWVSDVEGFNLRIYNAIPPSNGGNLTLINSFNIPGVTKFTRPVFGDGRAYIGTTAGYFYGFGSPVSLPLNCSSPYTFPNTPTGKVSNPVNITCLANTGVTINSIALTGNPNFNISNLPQTPLQLQQGQSFTFTGVFAPKSIGLLSSDVVINTTNAATGYTPSTPVTLKGIANSVKPLLSVRPNTVSFNTIAGQAPDVQSVILANQGDSILTFQNFSYSTQSETGPWISPNSTSNGTIVVGPFTFTNMPSTIAGNNIAPVSISYTPVNPGNDAVFVKAFSDGGNVLLDVLGVAGSQPAALFEFQTPDGSGWITYVPGQNFTFGNVTENTTRNLKFRVTNNGSSTAAPLSITVSKPPYGVPGIAGAANNVDLAEGTRISAGQSVNATLFCSPPKQQVNTPGYSQTVQWTINTGDPTLGKQFINFVCNAVSEQVGPLLSNGFAQYGYVGCARDNNPSRQLQNQVYADTNNNTNGRCLQQCFSQGYIFAATEYQSQCWCGNVIPRQFDGERDCNFQCTGDTRQTCGGNGFYHNQTQMSLFADSTKFNGNTTSPPLQIPPSYSNYNYIGCYAESGGKALQAKNSANSGMTVEFCGTFCSSYTYFGLEFSTECSCGNVIGSTGALTSDSQCGMTCGGSNSEYCGAGNRMQIYGLNQTASKSSSMSSTTTSSATIVSSINSVSSTVVSASTSTSSTSVLAVPTATSTTPAAPAYIGNYLYQGCYTEVQGRALQAMSQTNNNVTNTVCATFCQGYTFFATEYSTECFCGTTLAGGSVPATDGRCSMTCAGDGSQICGGANGLSLYMLNGTSAVPASQVVVPSISGYSSGGCYAEPTSAPRALPNLYANDSMSIEMCAAQAISNKAAYFGVEYGRECWYANALDARSQPIAQSNCNMRCPGNATEWCGGGNALQLYNLTGPAATSLASTKATSTIAGSSPATSLPSTLATAGTSSVSVSSSSVATGASTVTSSSLSTTSATSTSSILPANTAAPSNTLSNSTSSPASTTTAMSSTFSAPSTSSPSSTSTQLLTITTTIAATTGTLTSTLILSSDTTAASTLTSTVVFAASTSTYTSAFPSQTALRCPQSNSTIWYANSGAKFLIECGIDHSGGDLTYADVGTYEQCVRACDGTKGCVDVSMRGGRCYMKKAVGRALVDAGVLGAKLVPSNYTVSSTSGLSASTTVGTAK